MRGLSRTFGDRTDPAGSRPGHRSRRVHRADRAQRLGQVHAAARARGTGPGGDRPALGGGPGAVAFQEPRLVPWKRVLANVALGLRVADPQASARTALDEVGLAERASAWPATLSGGEAQRASLARALVREPCLLLLDEPFSALDALTRITMHRLVLSLWARHRPAVLLVTHDVDEALALADRVLVLGEGRITHSSPIGLPRPRDRDRPDLVALRLRAAYRTRRPGQGNRLIMTIFRESHDKQTKVLCRARCSRWPGSPRRAAHHRRRARQVPARARAARRRPVRRIR